MNIEPVSTIKPMSAYKPPLDGRRTYQGQLLDFNEKITSSQDPDAIYPEYGPLLQAVANYSGVAATQILLTAGSGSGIDLVFRTFCSRGEKVVIPSPSFSLLFQSAQSVGADIVSPQYDSLTGTYPFEEVMQVATQAKIIVVCSPNNPTGRVLEIDKIRQLASTYKDTIILVDEAYFEFYGQSAVSLIKELPNVVVLRTFSKAFGLASLRVGYTIADESIVGELGKIASPYPIAMPSAEAAQQALKDQESLQSYVNEVTASRTLLEDFFIEYAVAFYPSDANFICFKPRGIEAVFQGLLDRDIRVRKTINGTMLRVTVGDMQSAKAFMAAYSDIRSKKPQKMAIIDRDGTLIFEPQDTYQIDSVDLLSLLDGAIDGLKTLQEAGFDLVMITNQDGIGTDAYPRRGFVEVQAALMMQLADAGISFERVFVCPHLPEDACECRKPKTKLLDDYIKESSQLNTSIVIGDRASDVQLGINLKMQSLKMTVNSNFSETINSVVKVD